jgi:hypothetical protein
MQVGVKVPEPPAAGRSGRRLHSLRRPLEFGGLANYRIIRAQRIKLGARD